MATTGEFGDIFPPEREYKAPEPVTRKEFKPWHRLRKQYVRERQWCRALNTLLSGHPITGRPLKYIGLPGSELLDLRIIHNVICAPRQLPLRFLGFNVDAKEPGPEQIEIDLSMEEVKHLAFVDGESKIVPDDFRGLADPHSIAWNEADRLGPFDVINIDLCDGFGKERPGQTEDNYYNALSHLMEIQGHSRTPWALFLTTRIGGDHVHINTLARIRNIYDNNLRNCRPFAQLSKSAINVGSDKETAAVLRTPVGFNTVVITGLSKWLFGLGLNAKCMVTSDDLLGYTVRTGNPVYDLLSAVFVVTPLRQPPKDRHNLAAPRPKIAVPSECEAAVAFLTKTGGLLDIDQQIRSDESLKRGLLKGAVELMRAARYDGAAFSAWALENC